MRRVVGTLCLASALAVGADVAPAVPGQASQPLPDPLTLDDALGLTRADLPQLELAAAERDASSAAVTRAEAIRGLTVTAEGRLRAIEPSSFALNRQSNDSSARLALRKRLYDFGYSDAAEKAARLGESGSVWREFDARQQARLRTMRAFFDVVLADLQFARDNEAMAGAFIDADRARDRQELGRVSDVESLRLEADYQEALRLRNESQTLQRAARARLAVAMGRPDDLASRVQPPTAPDLSIALPDYDATLVEVLQRNPQVQALQAELEAAHARVDAAKADFGPVLSGELEATAYERKTNSTHPLAATLLLEVPLFAGGADDAAVAQARAGLRASRARLFELEQRLRQDVLDLVLRLENLRVRLRGLEVRGDYRELYLDRSRALYDLEVKTDLGDAMTEISALRLDVVDAEFDWAMTRARLSALKGELLPGDERP